MFSKGILKDWPSPHLKECPWYLDLPHAVQVPDDEVAISAIANVVPGGAVEPGPSAEELTQAKADALEADAEARKKSNASPEKGKKRARKTKPRMPSNKLAPVSGEASAELNDNPVSKRGRRVAQLEDDDCDEPGLFGKDLASDDDLDAPTFPSRTAIESRIGSTSATAEEKHRSLLLASICRYKVWGKSVVQIF